MTEIPASLEMSVGEQRDVELPSLGTAGYVWDAEIVGEGNVIDVHWTRGDILTWQDAAWRAGFPSNQTSLLRGIVPV